jgi:6-carboxyhexanoate--CoA ligase
MHISGAEGLYETSDVRSVVNRYIERALTHPKGIADKIVITIEDIKLRPEVISTLPLCTVSCLTPAEGKGVLTKLLQLSGISKKSIDAALKIIKKGNMRGAAVVTADSGERLEPDMERGVRVSRLGISKPASEIFSSKLSRHRINTDTVKEALILASKVVSCRNVVAELCVSDDPDYTTGYVASKKFGYVRIPHIKSKGSISGGRAFFVNGDADIKEIIHYLEKVPVITGEVSPCRGTLQLNEILNYPY